LPETTETPYQFGGNPLPITSKTPTESVDTKETPKKGKPKKKPISAPQALPARFEEFWTAFPCKLNRAAACRAWDNIDGMNDDLAQRIIVSVHAHHRTRQWRDGCYMHGATYLNDARYTDEIPGAYSPAEQTVLENFNTMLQAKGCYVEASTFDELRAAKIRGFLSRDAHPERGEFSARYFGFITKNVAQLPAWATFEWLLDNYRKVIDGDLEKQ
jgi:hypothetical protein